jgi:phosphomannomutase
MPIYAANLANAIRRETCDIEKPLEGLKIVLHAGHGSGSFFYNVLESLGADVSSSIGIHHDSTFPGGVPNPESNWMVDATIRACQESSADLGIMLDTDADRSGFIVPASGIYEPLHRNRLIALLGVIFQHTSPACTFVTDSVTSEGLADFLTNTLGLVHVRYLKGYANVIGKAKEITNSGNAVAEVAIETSGHCAMRENNYLDDGTYTAVKVIGLLAKVKKEGGNLLELISGMKEMSETPEFRFAVHDGTLDTTESIFRIMVGAIETACLYPHSMSSIWEIDEENLEGVRIRTLNTKGGFFMLRKSLHDPILSLQVEGESVSQITNEVVNPLLEIWSHASPCVSEELDLKTLTLYTNQHRP